MTVVRSTEEVNTSPDQVSRRDFVKTSLAVTFPALMGCTLGLDDGVSGDPRLTVRPGAPTTTPTVGLSELEIGAGRDGLLYVPQSYSAGTPAPLFVALHGAGGDADDWGSYHDRAEERGMIVLAVDSRSGTWDVIQGRRFGPDVEFMDQALAHIFERVLIDANRMALGGFSDGASYALSLGVSNGDLFSHLVAFSPGLFLTADPIVGKPLVYVSHGTNDPILPISASRNNIVPALRDADYDVTFEEFSGGHVVPADITESALDWFLGAG